IYALSSDRTHQVHRWIVLGPAQIQPSEIGKLALVLFLAYLMARKEAQVNDVVGTIIPCAVVVGQLALLVYLQPDLGTAAIYILLTIVLLFLAGLRWKYLLVWRGVVAAAGAPDRGGYYLGMGITTWFVAQAMMNMAVTLGLMPTKGIPLPFLSYGGSSLVVSLCALGVLLNISQHSS